MQQTIQHRHSITMFRCLFILLASLALYIPGVAHAAASKTISTSLAACAPAGDITPQSLLVVLLDRSGSLTFEPGATDPDGYSTSVTKALADLWPGKMAVVPFSNSSTPVIGPYPMSDLQLRDQLKNAVQNYTIGGNTPLDPAMQQALTLLKGAPAGSRVVIVTDGSPDPVIFNNVNQADDIRTNLLHQFCSQGIPVTTFGLALDLTQPDGQTADKLLRDIANGTGGTYTLVRNAHELAQLVVQLYAQWQHLFLLPAQFSNNMYALRIDTYATQVIFVTFRSGANYNISLNSPDGQPVPGQSVQRSTDRHYEIDNMVLSTVNQPGTYSINVSGDAQAQVYALVNTPLHAALVQPTSQTIAYIGQPLQIQAQLLNGTTPIIPKPNEATIVAQVSVQANGQTSNYTVELAQSNNSPLFSGQIVLHGAAGQVHVQIVATYLLIPVEATDAQVTIPLKLPPPVKPVHKPTPPPPPCTNVNCYLQRYGGIIFGGLGALLLLLLLLFLLRRRGSRGWTLAQSGRTEDLGSMGRPFMRNIFHKSVLSSRELEDYGGFDFNEAKFDLIFKHGVRIKAKSDEPQITVKQGSQLVRVTREVGGVELTDRDQIIGGRGAPAILREDIPDGN